MKTVLVLLLIAWILGLAVWFAIRDTGERIITTAEVMRRAMEVKYGKGERE